jgi:hypothetical protein
VGSVHNATGSYLVDFGNDVSSRLPVVTLFPSATAPEGQAVDCGANPTATATCNALNGSTLASPKNIVLVTTEDHSGTQCVRNLGNATPGSCNASNDFVGGAITSANASFAIAMISG